jgi:DNA-binding SARP family transcriptional activator
MLEYRALAGLTIRDGDEELAVGGPRQRRLLGVLLAHRGVVVSGDVLAEAVFDGDPPPGAHATIRSYVARLRHVLGRPAAGSSLVTQAPGYRLDVPDDAFDVARFERSVTLGRSSLAADQPQEAARLLRAGLALWHGEPYAEFAGEDWAGPEVARLDELRLAANDVLAEAGLACGQAAEVATDLEVLVAEHPLRESFQAKLMIALYRSGRHADALRSYQVYRRLLAEELGLEPEPELIDLERRILAHDETLWGSPAHHVGTLVGPTSPDRPGTTTPERVLGPGGQETDATARGRRGAVARRLGAQLVVLGIAVVLALVAGTVAVRRLDRVENEGRYAVARELAAASVANLELDPERSILLALAAVEQTRAAGGVALPEAVVALRRAVGASRAVLRVPGVGGTLAWSPDGATIAVEAVAARGIVELRDARTGVVRRSFATQGRRLRWLSFSPDGNALVTVAADAVRVWDLSTGVEVLTLPAPEGQGAPGPAVLSAGGALLALTWPGRDLVEVRDVGTGTLLREVRAVPAPLSVALDPTGTRLAVASGVGSTAVLVPLDGPGDPAPLAAPSSPLSALVWSPDGDRIAISSDEDGARIVDASTGAVQLTLPSSPGVTALDWCPCGARVATAGTDGVATVWQVDEHGPRALFRLATQDAESGLAGLDFSPDGTHLATTDLGRTALRVWDVDPATAPRFDRGVDGGTRSVVSTGLDVDQLVELARGMLTRTLTDDECERFLHVRPCP